MKYYICYLNATGLIVKKGMMHESDEISIQNSTTETALEVTSNKYNEINSSEEYVNNNQIVPREESPVIKEGPTSFVNIPYNTPSKAYLVLENERYEITESFVDLEITLPGIYTVLFECFPYKDKTFEVVIP